MRLSKLSKRERLLLLVLTLCVVCASVIYLLFLPQMERLKASNQQCADARGQFATFSEALKPDHPVYSELNILDSKVRMLTSLFFPELKQEKFILLLNDQAFQAAIDPDTLQYAGIDSVNLIAAEGAEKNGQVAKDIIKELSATFRGLSENKENQPSPEEIAKENEALSKLMGSVKKQTVTMNYKGNFGDFLKFMEVIESYSRRISIDQVTMSDFSGIQDCQVKLSYYAISKLHDQDSDYLSWDLEGEYGKPDPFYGSRPMMSETSVGGSTVSTGKTKPDFSLMLNPITSDLTTVIIAKMGDKSRESYVYADNEGFEPTNIEFTEENGKFYYKYSTTREAYPKEDQRMEFTPNGNDIRLQVISIKRNGKNDNSGASLTINNNTSLKCLIDIIDDDLTKSRIKWVKKTSNIVINPNAAQ